MNCQLIAMALERIDTELYQIYKLQGGVWHAGTPGQFTAAMER